MKRWFGIALTAAICVAAALLALLSQPAQTPRAGERLIAASEGLDEITIDAVFDPDSQTLSVSQAFSLYNRTGATQSELACAPMPPRFATRSTRRPPPRNSTAYAIQTVFPRAGLRLHPRV